MFKFKKITTTSENYPVREWDEPGMISYILAKPYDNFGLQSFHWKGYVWQTSEHAFQACKAVNKRVGDCVRLIEGPGPAKLLGRTINLRKDWEAIKFEAMWQILCAKFTDNKVAREALLSTGHRTIVEGNTWDDRIWGSTRAHSKAPLVGQNALGIQLMTIRGLIQNGVL